MKVAILGYGKEGKANEAYFKAHDDYGQYKKGGLKRGEKPKKGVPNEIEVIEKYADEDYDAEKFVKYDMILRSPSVRPQKGFSSGTQYFFDHCPATVIGVTGTKGKGTTCSMIAELLKAIGKKVWMVGNIGVPAIGELDKIGKHDVVVYELSSFQLWNVDKSPHIAVVLRIAPDHLNVHKDFKEYVWAKSHVAEFQGPEDMVVYFRGSVEARKIAQKSVGGKLAYPVKDPPEKLIEVLDALTVPGEHNRENAQAAVLAVAAYLGISLDELLARYSEKLKKGLANFKGLPHHIELVRELHGVSYYDDSFSTAQPALEVALAAFPERPVILIAGGQDKGVDLREMRRTIFKAPNLEKAFLIGEIARRLTEGQDTNRFTVVKSLTEAVEKAQIRAEALDKAQKPVVLLSPGAASFDMFKDYYDRGDQFQKLVKGLK